MKAILQNLARRFGVELLPAWQLADLGLARHLQKVFQRYNIQQVIDIGTNGGAYGEFLRLEVAYPFSILSYEAKIEEFRQLSMRSAGDQKWQSTLCEEQEESAYNALDKLAEIALPLPEGIGRMLKLDTQHLDFDVLDGANNTLQIISCLQLEIALPQTGNRASIIADTVGKLDQKGFTLSGLFPVVVDDRLCTKSFDCVFLPTASLCPTERG